MFKRGIKHKVATKFSEHNRVLKKFINKKNYICPACLEYFCSDTLYREHYKKAHSQAKLVKISFHD